MTALLVALGVLAAVAVIVLGAFVVTVGVDMDRWEPGRDRREDRG